MFLYLRCFMYFISQKKNNLKTTNEMKLQWRIIEFLHLCNSRHTKRQITEINLINISNTGSCNCTNS